MKFRAETNYPIGLKARFSPQSTKTGCPRSTSLALLVLADAAILYGAGCAGAAGLNGAGSSSGAPGHSVTLNWNLATSEVTAYNIYRSEQPEGPYARMQTVSAPKHQYVDAAIQTGGTYYYVVTSVASDGMESDDSIQVTARVP